VNRTSSHSWGKMLLTISLRIKCLKPWNAWLTLRSLEVVEEDFYFVVCCLPLLYVTFIQELKKGDASCAVAHRISKARSRFEMLFKPIFARSTISLVLKSRLFDALVRSVLLYGLKTTALTAADLHNIQVFDKSCQRRLVRGWQQRSVNGRLVWVSISDTELHQRTKLPEIGEQIELSRLRFV
jgi:hypothetical protein